MTLEHTTIVVTRTNAAGEAFVTNYDTRIAPVADIVLTVALQLGSAYPGKDCPAPSLPEGYRCDGCDCERKEQ